MSAHKGLRAICAAMISGAALSGAGFVAGPVFAQAAAQPSDACLALATDAERLVCMRDSRAAADTAAAEGAAAPGGAPAQSLVSQSGAAERCMALATDAEKLACMQGALAVAESALAAGGGAYVAAGEDDDGFLGLGLFGGGNEGGGAPANPLLASQAEFDRGYGAEQLPGYRNDEATEDLNLSASIVSYSEFTPGQLQFELDNGQVWRQLGGDTQRFPFLGRDPIPVVLSQSWAGGYRMTLLQQDRTVQVQRVE